MVACWHVTKWCIQPMKFWLICCLCLLIQLIPSFNVACLCFHKLLRSCNRLLLIMFYDICMLHSATFDEFHICTSLRDKHQAAANILPENLVVLNFYLIFCFHILVMTLNHEASYNTEFIKQFQLWWTAIWPLCVWEMHRGRCVCLCTGCVCAFLPVFVYSKSVFTTRQMIYWILRAFSGQKVLWVECCYANMLISSRYIYHFHHLSLAR